ncbi:MAG: DUF937 domain-containing protein [Pseudomonadota bacterium]
MSLLEQFTDVVLKQALPQASQKTGVDPDAAGQVMPVVVGALLNGLQKNASQVNGAEALASALEKHDGSLLNSLNKLSDDKIMSDGQKIITHILGAKKEETETMLAKTAGIEPNQVSTLMAMAAPALLAMLGREKNEKGLDAAALAGLVTEETTRVKQDAPAAMSGILGLLDKDGDGSVTDEILEAAGKRLFGSIFRKR